MSGAAAIWHDVECGAYGADLPLWDELAAAAAPGTVLELGCGTGRVALRLARRGHRVVGLDSDARLLAALREQAAGLPLRALHADAREFALPRPAALAIAPMQVVQLLPGHRDRLACLRAVAAALRPGGRFAAAIVESLPAAVDGARPLPDVREVDRWVYSSLPLEAAQGDGEIVVRRLRQTVSPAGELREELHRDHLTILTAAELEREAAAAGLRVRERLDVPDSEAHVGSAVLVLEASP